MAADTIEMRLADLQRSVDVGNAQTQGQLALLVQRSEQTAMALAEQRRWAEGEFARRDREAGVEETARQKGDGDLSEAIAALDRKAAMYAGVGMTLAAIGGTLLGHYLPH